MGKTHVFQGLRRDTHPINQDSEFLWDAHNIRLTARDGNTCLSITNEKSNKRIYIFPTDASFVYMGHATVGNYLVVFVHSTGSSTVDAIYRFEKDDLEGTAVTNPIVLYIGDLGLDPAHPLQCISDYEAELVQKVYWVDGINRPRVINVAKPELMDASYTVTATYYNISDAYTSIYTDAPFDFVQDLQLQELVTVTREANSLGLFASGVIQYAFTYCYKYGQETNIFYTSELLNISYSDRGADSESSVGTAFTINIYGVETRFDYLRIYSIQRTSLDGTPICKRVVDIDLSDDPENIVYTDTGTTGETVDSNMLLYVGGKDIIANCIYAKDNVLFLGGITYNRQEISSLTCDGETIDEAFTIACSTREITLSENEFTEDSFYNYVNQLCVNTSTFKGNETYRLGVQFQYKTGEWSEPVFLQDTVMDWSCRPSIEFSSSGCTLTLPIFTATVDGDWIIVLYNAGYRKMRGLVVLPEPYEKNIIAQGMVCPTVFQAISRNNNTPFAQSSWFMRPMGTTPTAQSNTGLEGSVVQHNHFMPLTSGRSSGAEIQNLAISEYEVKDNSFWSDVASFTYDLTSSSEICVLYYGLNTIASGISENETSCYGVHYVDQSIGTIHSPDIEFNDNVQLGIDSGSGLGLRIVGAIPFTHCYGDLSIQLSSIQADPDAKGVVTATTSNSTNGGKGLVAGLFYQDSPLDDDDDSIEIIKDSIREWMIYPWHRNGSLNNDIVRPTDYGTRTAELSTKVMSNIRYSEDNYWMNWDSYSTGTVLDVQDIKLFNSDDIAVIKLADSYNNKGAITYYGNVDTLNPAYAPFKLVTTSSVLTSSSSDTDVYFKGTVSVDIDDETSSASVSTMYIDVSSLSLNATDKTISFVGTVNNVMYSLYYIPSLINGNSYLYTAFYDQDIYFSGTYSGSTSSITATVEGSVIIGEYTYVFSGTVYGIDADTDSDEEVDAKDTYMFDASIRYLYHWYGTNGTYEESSHKVGKYYGALAHPNDAVRIKYKSTPHAVFALNYDDNQRQVIPYWYSRGSLGYTSVSQSMTRDGQFWSSITDTSSVTRIGLKTSASSFVDGTSHTIPSAYLWLCEIYRNDVTNRFGGTTKEALMSNTWLPAGTPIFIISGVSSTTLYYQWGDTWYQRYDCLKTYPYSSDDPNQMIEIGSFMCETSINIDGRYDRNRGLTSNLNVSPTNFNLINTVYSQKNNFFTYRIYDEDYYKVNDYPNQLMWTEVKSPASYPDEWTNLHTANTLNLDGTNGGITALDSFNNLLLGFQETSVNQILFNSRVQLEASDGVPIEIANNATVEGYRVISNSIGCQDKFGICTTPMGIYFFDNYNSAIYLYNGELKNLSLDLGSLYWCRENYCDNEWVFYNTESTEDGNNGIRIFYDNKYQDVYFTPGRNYGEALEDIREALVYSEQLQHFTSFISYGGSVLIPFKSKLYAIANYGDSEYLGIYKNFAGDGSNQIFGIERPYSISFISNDEPTVTKIFNNIEMRADLYDSDDNLLGSDLTHTSQTGKPFNYIEVSNEYQDTGTVTLTDSNMRKKFRIWRAIIPRNSGTRQRIRNPWAKITLGSSVDEGNENTNSMILHHLDVKQSYSI